MALWLKQGDEYYIGITAELNEKRISVGDVAVAEFCVGDIRKMYPGEVTYDNDLELFLIPVTQEETFQLTAGEAIPLDMRAKFKNGQVMGFKTLKYVTVYEALSREVI